MNSGEPIVLVYGQPTVEYIQCYAKGTNPATGQPIPAVYNATDILTGAVVASGQAAAVFAPAIAFYTAVETQTGYGQGQIAGTFSTANMVLLVPSVRYTLEIYRALLGAPSVTELIARRRLVILPLAIP